MYNRKAYLTKERHKYRSSTTEEDPSCILELGCQPRHGHRTQWLPLDPRAGGPQPKSPQLFVLLGVHSTGPGLVVEVGFAQSFSSLVQDAGLLLLGTGGATKCVIVIKLYEGPVESVTENWPAGVEPPKWDDVEGMLERKKQELARWLVGGVGTRPLVGKMRGVVALYTRSGEEETVGRGLPGRQRRGQRVGMEEGEVSGDCLGSDEEEEEEGAEVEEQKEMTYKPFPWILNFPLNALYDDPATTGTTTTTTEPTSPPQLQPLNPILTSHGSGTITFDLFALVNLFTSCRPNMELWRATTAAETFLQDHLKNIQVDHAQLPQLQLLQQTVPQLPILSRIPQNTWEGGGEERVRPQRNRNKHVASSAGSSTAGQQRGENGGVMSSRVMIEKRRMMGSRQVTMLENSFRNYILYVMDLNRRAWMSSMAQGI
ncbi:hypothetical protein DFH27DRAFT_639343 [Peziza echinospora]|nr:hypothetical protein DFH27DRAFT_639343 [Peziza echinospora]